jgi:hypothetical protein
MDRLNGAMLFFIVAPFSGRQCYRTISIRLAGIASKAHTGCGKSMHFDPQMA